MAICIDLQQTWTSIVPILQTGDFNADCRSEAYSMLTRPAPAHGGFYYEDTYKLARSWKKLTNVSPPPDYDPLGSIDHIFVNSTTRLVPGKWTVNEWFVDMYKYPYGGQMLYPSDHFAVAATVQLTNP